MGPTCWPHLRYAVEGHFFLLLLYIECVSMIFRRFAITAPSESKAASKCCSYFFGFHFSRTLVSWNAAGWYVLFQAPMLEAWPMDGPGIFLEIPSVCRRHFKTQGFFPVAPIYLHLFGPGAPKDGKTKYSTF